MAYTPSLERVRQRGRPEYWTEEKLKETCTSLLEWAQKDSSITLTEWRADEEISWDMVKYLKQISKDFSHSYDLAKAKVAARITKKAGRGVHPIHYNRYVATYDKELHEHDMEVASAKAQSVQAAKQEQIDEGKGVMERLSSTLSADS